MTQISFTKMEASGNDFVVVDNRRGPVKRPHAFTRKVCTPHTGVGADGVLLLEKGRKGRFSMRIINSDGSEAEACGNGFRCIARYARERLGLPGKFTFDTGAGPVEAMLKGKKIRVRMARPKDLAIDRNLRAAGRGFRYSFLNTGVPHVVVFVTDVQKMDVVKYGRAIREHAAFRPKGTNVNFVQVLNSGNVRIRTYERGVENETLACGTGATASAILSCLHGFCKAPVNVTTKSGERLKIDYVGSGQTLEAAFMEGEARFVFDGRLLF